MPMAADPFVVHVARLRRSPGQAVHEVRRGEVAQAGPDRRGRDRPGPQRGAGRRRHRGRRDADPLRGRDRRRRDGHAPRGRGSAGAVPSRCRASCGSRVHERFADAPLAGASDEELYPIVDETIDLGPLARDAVVLELPMAPLCREDCAGLCPQCGANRNEGDCGCVAPRDPRWANLDVLR